MSSKFSNILQARNRPSENEDVENDGSESQSTDAQSVPEAKPQRAAPTKGKTAAKPKRPTASAPEAREGETASSTNRGRPRTGKSSDPNYTQITAYILKTTHTDTKVALLQEGEGRELSELVEECLLSWLNQRKQVAKSSNT